jgi:hypothetical protein
MAPIYYPLQFHQTLLKNIATNNFYPVLIAFYQFLFNKIPSNMVNINPAEAIFN